MRDLLFSSTLLLLTLIGLLNILRMRKIEKKIDHNLDVVEINFNDFVEKANHNNKGFLSLINQLERENSKLHKRIDELQPKEEAEEQPKRKVGRPKKVKGE